MCVGGCGVIRSLEPQPYLCGHQAPEAGLHAAVQEESADEEAEEKDVGEQYGENHHLARRVRRRREEEDREHISRGREGQGARRGQGADKGQGEWMRARDSA